MSQITSAHQILGLTANASPEAIKAAYRALARQWHPDQFTDAADKAEAEAKLKEINIAYAQLKQLGDASDRSSSDRPSSQAPSDSPKSSPASESPRVSVSHNAAERMRSRAELLYKQAQELAKADRFREATDALDQALRLCDDYLEAYEYRGALYEKRGFERLAHRDLSKARELRLAQRPNPSSRPSQSSPPASDPPKTRSGWFSKRKTTANNKARQRTPDHSAGQGRSAGQASVHDPNHDETPLPFQRPIRLSHTTASLAWRCRDEVMGHAGAITAIALLRKNRFVTASQDGTLRLWQFQRHQPTQPIATLSAHRGAVLGLAISADGQQIASHGEDGSVKRWQLPNTSPEQTFPTGPVRSLIFGPERQTLTYCDDQGQIRQWSSHTGNAANATWASRAATYLDLSQDRKFLLTRTAEGYLHPWSMRKETPLSPLDDSQFEHTALCLSDDGKYVAAGKTTGEIYLWHVQTGQPTMAIAGLSGRIQAIAMSPDRILAAADATGRIWLVDLVTRTLLCELSPPSLVTQLHFAPDYGQLISGHRDGSIKIWHR